MPVDFKNEMRRCWIFSWVCLRIASDSDSFGIGSVIEEIGMVPLAFRAVENNNAENTRLQRDRISFSQTAEEKMK